MNAALQEFVKVDNGFEQYAERYEDVSSDLAVRRQFAAWTAEMDKLEIWKAIGVAEGIEIGELKSLVKSIHKKTLKNKSREQIIDGLELDIKEIEILDNLGKYMYLL